MSSRLFTHGPAIIDAVHRLGQISTAQLDRLVFSEASVASNGRQCRRTLQRLHEDNQIKRLDRSIGGAGSEGYTWVPPDSDRDPKRADPHALDISELYVRLKSAERLGHCTIEDFEVEDFIQRTRTKFDARLKIATSRRREYYIEIDRGTMRRPQLRAKHQAYARSFAAAQAEGQRGYPAVLYVVTYEPRGRLADRVKLIQEIGAVQPVPALFTVCTLDQAVPLLVGRSDDA